MKRTSSAAANRPSVMGADEADRSAIKSLRKAMALLNVIAEADRPLTIAAAAMTAGISRPTAYRVIQTLVGAGFVEQDGQDGRLSIGFAVLPLASSLLDRNRMRLEALSHLHALAQKSGERANLGMLYRDRVLYIAGVEKPVLPTIYSRFGKNAPAHCSSLGKAILAFLPEKEVSALLARTSLARFTPTTITSRPAFLKELSEIRKRGYATDRAEHLAGSFCLAAPIFGSNNRAIGAIGLSGRALDPLIEHKDLVCQTAEVISHHLQ
ncbi:MAG: IclR family transcriptional regulator [Bradyrhizobiaceae bacterium]|nr:IclR family transcriptional regulator [Bradyrhizobiaceae bacterium]